MAEARTIWGAQAASLQFAAACREDEMTCSSGFPFARTYAEKKSRFAGAARSVSGKLPETAGWQPMATSRAKRNSVVPFSLFRQDISVTNFALQHGDCIAGMATLKDGSIDLIVTSPPYNLGIAYGHYSDRQERGAYLDWCVEWATAIRRILKIDGSLFLNVGAAPSNPLLPHELVIRLQKMFVLQNTIHWIKAISLEDETGTVISRGHFKPISSPRYLNDCHEYVFHFTAEGRTPIDRLALGVPYQDKSNIARWSHTSGKDKRCRGNTWFVPYETIKSRDKQRPHPATFPVQLAVNCIKLHGTERVQTMLDPFLGIGNSAVAAQRCGVPEFIGFEIDETYLREAKQRTAARSPGQ